MAAHRLYNGEKFDDRYLVESHLGGGSFAEVYGVLDTHGKSAEPYALKLLDSRASTEDKNNFHTEADMLIELDNPGVVKGYHTGQEADSMRRTYLIMELIHGRSLYQEQQANARNGMHPLTAAEYIKEAAVGVDYLHSQGIFHRDLSAKNVLIDPSRKRTVIVDLGLAAYKGSAAASQPVNAGFHTPPEAIEGEYTEASDQFALAFLAYTLLAGYNSSPFIGWRRKNDAKIIPFALQGINCTTLHTKAERVLKKGMAPNPDRRYGSAEEFAAAFHEIVQKAIQSAVISERQVDII